MMKAETKAKRRATLSICGLGIPDESEIETFDPQAYYEKKYQETTALPSPTKANLLLPIESATTEAELREAYQRAYSEARGNEQLQKEIIMAKDKRKNELDNASFNPETGEILQHDAEHVITTDEIPSQQHMEIQE